MRDYAGFGDAASMKNAVLVECGPHSEPSSVEVAKDSVARFLQTAGVAAAGDLPGGWQRPETGAQQILRVTDAVVATGTDLRFVQHCTGLEVIADAGSVIRWNGGVPVTTPYADCVLVMPSRRQVRARVTLRPLERLSPRAVNDFDHGSHATPSPFSTNS